MQFQILRQVFALDQILVHADSALGLATATKQATECKVNFDGLRVYLDGFDKGLDGPIGLLVEQEVEALEIRTWQGSRFLYQMADINARGCPPQAEEQREKQQLPVLELDHP